MSYFPIESPQAEEAPEIAKDAFQGLNQMDARREADKKHVPTEEAQKATSQCQEAYCFTEPVKSYIVFLLEPCIIH